MDGWTPMGRLDSATLESVGEITRRKEMMDQLGSSRFVLYCRQIRVTLSCTAVNTFSLEIRSYQSATEKRVGAGV